MSVTNDRRKGQAIIVSLVILFILALVTVGFGVFRYVSDRSSYEKGHQAYLQAECSTAIGLFEKIVSSSRLFDINQYAQRAQLERDECDAFQKAYLLEMGGNLSSALVTYLDFVSGNANSPLVEAARARVAGLFQTERLPLLASEASCTRTGELLEKNLIPNQETNLPMFYLGCGQMYEQVNQPDFAFAMYQWIMTSYPQNPASLTAETTLLSMPLTCEKNESLGQSVIANRIDFMPRLYKECGLQYEADADYANARIMYETFLTNYPEHALAQEVESALARTIVAQAQASGAGEIAQPESRGTTASGVVQIVIQNDSPERLRITFSGPQSQVEELEACSTCITYGLLEAPLYCPETGPIGQYTLPPGTYDIVVESISDSAVTPWVGHWSLADGNEYFRCIFLTTRLQ